MATTVQYAHDVSASVSKDGLQRVREKLINASGIEEMVQGNLIPQYGSRHPENSLFRLVSGDLKRIGNEGGTFQYLFTGTYSTRLDGSSGGSSRDEAEDDRDPWELGAQNFQKDSFTFSSPVLSVINRAGEPVPFLNSAHCRMSAEQELYGDTYSFLFCLRYRNGARPNVPGSPVVNSETVRIAGETFPAYSALLLPPKYTLINDRDDNGELLRSYWEVSCVIRKHPQYRQLGWFTAYPDIGTLALDETGKPAPVYRYIPWTSKDEQAKMTTAPAYGTIKQVIAAKHTYASLWGNRDDEYWRAWKELPYEEVTEPLPLHEGHVYTQAMSDPVLHPYGKIVGTCYEIGSFRQFDLPENREGLQ